MQTFKICIWVKTGTKTMTCKTWYVLFCDGFSINDVDKCVYIKYEKGDFVHAIM